MIVQQVQAGQEIPVYLGLPGCPLREIRVFLHKPGSHQFGIRAANKHPSYEIGEGWYIYTVAAVDVDTVGANILKAETETHKGWQSFTVLPAPPPPKPEDGVPVDGLD